MTDKKMKKTEESLYEMIEFTEKQRATEIRRLKAKGKPEKSAKVDAYTQVINQLSSMLSKKNNS